MAFDERALLKQHSERVLLNSIKARFSRAIVNIKRQLEDVLLTKENHREYSKYEKWISEYFELTDEDRISILKKVERLQTSTIIFGMRKQDREIFINNLGVFYIKPTTIDYYKSLERNIAGRQKDEYDFEEVHKSALEECRALFIKRANNKRDAKKPIEFKI
jgi:hypothetical protein